MMAAIKASVSTAMDSTIFNYDHEQWISSIDNTF